MTIVLISKYLSSSVGYIPIFAQYEKVPYYIIADIPGNDAFTGGRSQ